jgi:hypothetical protein
MRPTPVRRAVAALAILAAGAADSAALECGTTVTPAEAQAYLEKLESTAGSGAVQGGGPYYVGIKPHIVRQTDGTLGLSEARYNQALADANLHFLGADIQFYTAGPIEYIDSNAFYYDVNTLAEIDVLRQTNLVPNTINMYFTEVLDYENGALCGISAFTFSTVQSIAMRNSCTANDAGLGNHSTFSHEIGHYFDLFHTHETAFANELVNGSNCATAGDLVCDTPADPTLGSSTVNSGTCTYTGSATDSNGDPYVPDATQLMSYSLKHCRDHFSSGSLAKAQGTLLNDRPGMLANAVAAPDLGEPVASGFSLSPARPNPAAAMTELTLTLARAGRVEATVHDIRGARVRTIAWGPFASGTHVLGWDGHDSGGHAAAPGTYFVRLVTDDGQVVRKVQRLR